MQSKVRLPGAKRLRRFATDEGGAVTVDFVVLTAAVIVMAMSVFTIVRASIFETYGNDIATAIITAGNQ